MATYPLILKPSFSYEDHLMHNQYVADINKGLARAASEIVKGQAYSAMAVAETMNRNADFLAKTITGSAEMISQDVQDLTRTVEYGLDQVADGIAGLRADFDIAMGQVISQFEMMRAEMRAGFDRMIDILENRRKTEAQEHFRDALEFYRDGSRITDKPQWFDDALKHFLASVEQYERNPLAHLLIGHIYHYQKQDRDFKKALHHYQLCYTYGEADEKDCSIAAQGYFYAGWLNAAAFDYLEAAISLTEKSVKLDPKMGEAHYHLAKFHALRGEAKQAVDHLERAIVDFDRNYCRKAEADPDFNNVRDAVHDLFEKLKQEARQRFEEVVGPLDRDFDPKDKKWRRKLEKAWKNIDALKSEGTYFAYLDALIDIKKLEGLIVDARKAREGNYEWALRVVKEWGELIHTHECLDPLRKSEVKNAHAQAVTLVEEDDYEAHNRAVHLYFSNAVFGQLQKFKAGYQQVSSAAFSPNARFIVSGGWDNRVRLWELEKGKSVPDFDGDGHKYYIYSVSFSPDGAYIVSGAIDGIIVWDARTGKSIQHLKPGSVESIAFSPDGKLLGASNSKAVLLYDFQDGKLVPGLECKGHSDDVKSIAFSPCGRFVVSGSEDRTIRLWDVQNGKPIPGFDGRGHSDEINSVAFSPDGLFIVSGGKEKRIHLWETINGKTVLSFNTDDWIESVVFSPDGRFIISGGWHKISLWDAKTGKLLTDSHSTSLKSIAISPDGQLLVSGHDHGDVILWSRGIRGWITKDEHQRIQAEKQRQEEEKRREEQEKQRAEGERRRREGLCLKCGEPIGFLQKLKRSHYCKYHVHAGVEW